MNKIDVLKFNDERVNKVYGPYSLNTALAMLDEGATGYSKEALDSFLNGEVLTKYNNIENVLAIANKMYLKKDIANEINVDYKNVLADKYNAEVEINDFENAQVINEWISNKTFGQIKNAVSDSSVRSSNLLLINTTAIDMQWKYEIDPKMVNQGIFNNGSEVMASYVYGFTQYMTSYYEDEEVLSLGIDLKEYNNNKFDCVLIEPKNMELDQYINMIDDNKIYNIFSNLRSLENEERKVDIAVPKFSFSYDLKTRETLGSMGLENIFENPELGRISNLPTLKLDMIHKTNIDFSEKGLKAASATVIVLLEGAFMDTREVLTIDINKPFLFVIRNKDNNDILFMGTVYEPLLWSEDSKNYSYE